MTIFYQLWLLTPPLPPIPAPRAWPISPMSTKNVLNCCTLQAGQFDMLHDHILLSLNFDPPTPKSRPQGMTHGSQRKTRSIFGGSWVPDYIYKFSKLYLFLLRCNCIFLKNAPNPYLCPQGMTHGSHVDKNVFKLLYSSSRSIWYATWIYFTKFDFWPPLTPTGPPPGHDPWVTEKNPFDIW